MRNNGRVSKTRFRNALEILRVSGAERGASSGKRNSVQLHERCCPVFSYSTVMYSTVLNQRSTNITGASLLQTELN